MSEVQHVIKNSIKSSDIREMEVKIHAIVFYNDILEINVMLYYLNSNYEDIDWY